MIIFKPEKLIRIKINISDKNIGIYILQLKKTSNSLYIKKITLAEFNYNIYNKRLLIIIAIFQI